MFFQPFPFRNIVAVAALSLPVVALNVDSALAKELAVNLHNDSSMDIH